MSKNIKVKTISSWSKDTFDKDLDFELTLVYPEDLIDIKFSTNTNEKDQINFCAIVIYKG